MPDAPVPTRDVKKIVLAYSGGLDTSIILKWLQTTYRCEIVTFTADLGQGEELAPARDKALLLGIAPPVDRYDFEALKTCTLPKFIIHGEEDELISIKEIRKFYAQLPEPKELVTIEDANHLFEGKTSMVGDAVEDLLADFNTIRR